MALRALPRPLPVLSPDGTPVPRCGGRLTTHVRLLTHAVQCSRRLAPNRDRQGADANFRNFAPAAAAMILIALACGAPAARGAEPDPAAKEKLLKSDVLFRALSDELERSRTLQLNGDLKPYFISYAAEDTYVFQADASLGGVLESGLVHLRPVTVRIRVGDYKFDNSNAFFSGQLRMGALPLDDDYFALRTGLWLSSDQVYKRATDELTGKKNILRDSQNPEHAPDFAPQPPIFHLEEVPSIQGLDQQKWTSEVARLSGRFASHPEVLASSVTARRIVSTTRYVNTEGTVTRLADQFADLEISGRILTAEGYQLHDAILLTFPRLSDLPDESEISRQVDQLATELEDLRRAPQAEDYSGPVLFEAPAAAGMFAAALFDALSLPRKPVAPAGQEARQIEGVWSSRMGGKVLPEWLNVYDDPAQSEFRGAPLSGHYEVDDEGVPAQKVAFVEHGQLKNFLLSRTPVRDFVGSDGHARLAGPYGSEMPVFGNLFVDAEHTETQAALKAKFLEMVKANGQKFGIVIRRLDFPYTADFGEIQQTAKQLARLGAAHTVPPPVLAYRVYLDGHEELVRGLLVKELSARDLRNLVAAGDTPYVLNYLNTGAKFGWLSGSTDACLSSVVSPAVLFDSLDLARQEEEGNKPPVVPAPTMTALRETCGAGCQPAGRLSIGLRAASK
jgi:TldD protein